MKTLSVDLGEIAEMMEMGEDFENEGYLDTETGKTVLLPPELVNLDDRDNDDLDQLPGWEKELVPVARVINEGSDRYAPIPEVPSDEAYELLAEFARSVADPGCGIVSRSRWMAKARSGDSETS